MTRVTSIYGFGIGSQESEWGERFIAVQIPTGRDQFPWFTLVVTLFFCFVPRGKSTIDF